MTQEQKSELEKIQKEVENYYFELEKIAGQEIGCKIFYSNLSNQTDILFIGINPGTGDDNTDKDVKLMENGLQYFLPNWSNNKLATNTLEAFKKAGYDEKLKQLNSENKLVKTNLYYLLTKDSITLDEYINIFGQEFKDKHIDWTNRIINLCKPKLIIFEGKFLAKDCPPSFENTLKTKEYEDSIVYEFNGNLKGILYSRTSFGIKNIDELSALLKIELDNIYN